MREPSKKKSNITDPSNTSDTNLHYMPIRNIRMYIAKTLRNNKNQSKKKVKASFVIKKAFFFYIFFCSVTLSAFLNHPIKKKHPSPNSPNIVTTYSSDFILSHFVIIHLRIHISYMYIYRKSDRNMNLYMGLERKEPLFINFLFCVRWTIKREKFCIGFQ